MNNNPQARPCGGFCLKKWFDSISLLLTVALLAVTNVPIGNLRTRHGFRFTRRQGVTPRHNGDFLSVAARRPSPRFNWLPIEARGVRPTLLSEGKHYFVRKNPP